MIRPPAPVRYRHRLLAALLALLLGAVGPFLLAPAENDSVARAETFDPSAPQIRVVGPPSGPAPRARIDSMRSGRSKTALPKLPVELWRQELPRMKQPPLVDDDGEIVIALENSQITRLHADGSERWQRYAHSAPLTAPVLTSDGSVVVVDNSHLFLRIDQQGEVRVRRALGGSTSGRSQAFPPATPLALDDGSVVLVLGDALLRIDAGGAAVAKQHLPGGAVGGVLRWHKRFVLTSRNGTVWAWSPPADLRKLGKFSGYPNGGALLASEHTLVAVVDRERLVAMDLNNGEVTPLLTGTAVMSRLEGPPTLDHNGVLLVTSSLGELLGLDSHGVLLRRTPLDNVGLFRSLDGGATIPSYFRRSRSRQSPGLIVDRQGRLAFLRGTGRVGMLNKNGRLTVLEGRLCRSPIALVPAGKGRLLVACESGTLAMYGDRKP